MTELARKLAVLAAVAAGIVGLDQATKAWIQGAMRLYESRPVIPGLFHLTYLRNPGAAFGFLADHAEAFRRPFFLIVTSIALVVILGVVARLPREKKWMLAALSLVFGGAVGNLIDRVRWGEVVDFLDVFWKTHHWPPFNVADSAITVGMTILIAEEFFGKKAGKPGGPADGKLKG